MKLLQKQKEKINGEPIIYHGSTIDNLTEITPNKCKHDNAYVYASLNKALCIIFSVKRICEDIYFCTNTFGKTEIYEMYEGAFEDRFLNKSTNLYKLPLSYFKNETEYIELVSTKPVPVISVEKIENAADYLLALEQKHQVKIYRYNKLNKKNKDWIDEKLKKALNKYKTFKYLTEDEFNRLSEHDKFSYNTQKQRYENCKKKFKEFFETN